MNREETRKAIEIMQVYAAGNNIQSQNRGDDHWVTLTTVEPYWNWKTSDYRIKPKPREFLIYPILNERRWGVVENVDAVGWSGGIKVREFE